VRNNKFPHFLIIFVNTNILDSVSYIQLKSKLKNAPVCRLKQTGKIWFYFSVIAVNECLKLFPHGSVSEDKSAELVCLVGDMRTFWEEGPSQNGLTEFFASHPFELRLLQVHLYRDFQTIA